MTIAECPLGTLEGMGWDQALASLQLSHSNSALSNSFSLTNGSRLESLCFIDFT